MTPRPPTPEEIERAFARARQMQADLARRERAVGRKIQTMARALAAGNNRWLFPPLSVPASLMLQLDAAQGPLTPD
jgi:hypothetical protein